MWDLIVSIPDHCYLFTLKHPPLIGHLSCPHVVDGHMVYGKELCPEVSRVRSCFVQDSAVKSSCTLNTGLKQNNFGPENKYRTYYCLYTIFWHK